MTSSPPIADLDQQQAPAPMAEEQTRENQEPTKDQPVSQAEDPYREIMARVGKPLLNLISQKRDGWLWKRRGIVLLALKNKQFLKGDQVFGAYPGQFDAFNVTAEFANITGNDGKKNADESMDQRPH